MKRRLEHIPAAFRALSFARHSSPQSNWLTAGRQFCRRSLARGQSNARRRGSRRNLCQQLRLVCVWVRAREEAAGGCPFHPNWVTPLNHPSAATERALVDVTVALEIYVVKQRRETRTHLHITGAGDDNKRPRFIHEENQNRTRDSHCVCVLRNPIDFISRGSDK